MKTKEERKKNLTPILKKIWTNDFKTFQLNFCKHSDHMNAGYNDWQLSINFLDYDHKEASIEAVQKVIDQDTVLHWFEKYYLPKPDGYSYIMGQLAYSEEETRKLIDSFKDAGWEIKEWNTGNFMKNTQYYIFCKIQATWNEIENKLPKLN